MNLFRNMLIQRKLLMILTIACNATLFLACGAFTVQDYVSHREAKRQALATSARIVGNNCTAALSFDDPAPAHDLLAALAADPQLEVACVFNSRGEVFASYTRDGSEVTIARTRSERKGGNFSEGRLQVMHDVHLGGQNLGSVYLQTNLSDLRARLWLNLEITVAIVVVCAVLAFLVSSWLQRFVSGPLERLGATARRVAADHNFTMQATKEGDDEIGRVVDAFNDMLVQIRLRDEALKDANESLEQRVGERTQELSDINSRLEAEVAGHWRARLKLEETHQQLIEASRQAGMAEVATEVLHNVGNVLNSVNVSSSILTESLRRSQLPLLTRVNNLLSEKQADLAAFLSADPKGRQVPRVLRELEKHLLAENESLRREADELSKNVDHIKTIVVMQQSFARRSEVCELLSVQELLEDALQIEGSGFERYGIELIRDYQPAPHVCADRHRVLQILVNLLRNARQALRDSPDLPRRIIVRVAPGRAGWVNAVVRDNGAGIAPEHLNRIFEHGFTTKADGHGFGLHSSALAAREMRGRLTAQSDGVGTGAAFALELPEKRPPAAEAAA